MKSILFVDDEINILKGLKRLLNNKKKVWRMEFVESGEEALELLKEHTFDVVVSDMRMPCMNGVRLLTTIRVNYPRMGRIALSGYSDTEMILESIKATHLFISKPTDYSTLTNAIDRCLFIQSLIQNEDLCDFISGMSSLPCLPEVYNQLVRELSSQDSSIDSVGNIIEQDIVMSAKLLQIVNSAYFGLAREIFSPTEAASHLGLDIIKSLVLTIKVFESFENVLNSEKTNRVFARSQTIAQLATVIAKAEGFDKKECNQLLTAGLLQDIGELVIFNYFPKALQEEFNTHTDVDLTLQIKLEREIYGVSHEQISVYLLHLWGIPLPIVECVAFHQSEQAPLNFDELSLSNILYLSNLLDADRCGNRLPENIVSNEGFQEFRKRCEELIT